MRRFFGTQSVLLESPIAHLEEEMDDHGPKNSANPAIHMIDFTTADSPLEMLVTAVYSSRGPQGHLFFNNCHERPHPLP